MTSPARLRNRTCQMMSLPRAFALAFGQLGDRAVLMVVVKSIAITLAIFGLGGGAALHALYGWLVSTGFGFSAELSALAGLLLVVLAGWLLFRIVALAVLQFFADEIVAAVEARHYPQHASSVRKVPLGEELGHAVRGGLRALGVNLLALPFALVLLVTGIGTALLFWAVNGWLLGRELQDMVWLRHRRDPAAAAPLGKLDHFLLGGTVAAIMVVPFLNLLAPIVGAAAATHLVHRERY